MAFNVIYLMIGILCEIAAILCGYFQYYAYSISPNIHERAILCGLLLSGFKLIYYLWINSFPVNNSVKASGPNHGPLSRTLFVLLFCFLATITMIINIYSFCSPFSIYFYKKWSLYIPTTLGLWLEVVIFMVVCLTYLKDAFNSNTW